jgi:mannose-6-phosphate isomerase-like protein (cupin superfamily)
MTGYVKDIETAAIGNLNFRQVLYTAQHSQLVIMCLKPGEDIGMETHALDQFFRVEEGAGEVVLNDVKSAIHAGFAILVPAGARHNIVNTGDIALKLITLYAPPNHRDGIVHATRADAQKDNETFNGKLTERRIPVTVGERSQIIPITQRPTLSLRVPSAPTSRT